MEKSGLDIGGYRERSAGAVGIAVSELTASRRDDPRAAMVRMVAAYLPVQGEPTAGRRYCSSHGRERIVGARFDRLHRATRQPLLRVPDLHRKDTGEVSARKPRGIGGQNHWASRPVDRVLAQRFFPQVTPYRGWAGGGGWEARIFVIE